MAEKDSKFRFLTMEEFNQLARREKVIYLERATEEIKKRKTAKPSLFKDGPPLPQSPRKNPRGGPK
jgi:hypothetical protein